ncbi:hypothetical protein AWH63_10775 [Marinobacter sp. C18]|uniref:hypothetical protein n=1 Tax=Marinobacter sp. C18 TaxID=1772288 RepID=UPI000948A3A0|nr:hypothetical protein [Marinobacter sp. C18]OLF82014.1 hypothetical protein AWH63_10775 [Marinobacter sp. C18]
MTTPNASQSLFDIEFTTHPRRVPEIAQLEQSLVTEINNLAASERQVLDYTIPRNHDQADARRRVEYLVHRRKDTDMASSNGYLRSRTARKYAWVAGALFLSIPLLGLIKPDDGFLAASEADNVLLGYNATFVAFISLLASAMFLCVKAVTLLFEPFLSKRLHQFHAASVDAPQFQMPVLPYYRLVFIDQANGGLRWPSLRRYYRLLRPSDHDLRAAAIEHLHALEVRRLMSL